MGQDLYTAYPTIAAAYDSVALDFDVKALSFSGPEEQLSQTAYTQSCMVAYAIAVTQELKNRGIVPQMTAGLSLGEYSALYCAGALGAAQALELVRFRGQAMERAAQGQKTKMAAMLGIGPDALEQVVAQASQSGFVQIANYNCPGQIVIAGDEAGVDAAIALAKENGCKRAVPLAVSGPFHTSLMAPAARELEGRFAKTEFAPLEIPVVHNAVGRPMARGENLAQLLVRQVMSPVRFEASIRYMAEQGVDTIIEIGPGHALSGFIRKTAPQISTVSVEDCATLEAAVELVKGEKNGTDE